MTVLKDAITEASRIGASVVASARDLSRLPTATLYGVLGGGAITLLAYALTVFFPLSFAVIGPLSAIVGISSGVLFARWLGKNSDEARAEDRRIAIERNREVAQLLRDEMTKPGTSKAMKDNLSERISILNDELTKVGLLGYEPQTKIPPVHLKFLPTPLKNP